MHRARVVLGNDAVLRNGCLAHLRRRRKAVTVFGEEVNQLPSSRVRKLRVDVELRWRRTVLLRWRGFVSNRGDFGGVSEFLDVAHGCTFREVLRFLSDVRHEDHGAPILKFSYSSCDAYSSSQEQLKVAFQDNFAAGSCIGHDGYDNT